MIKLDKSEASILRQKAEELLKIRKERSGTDIQNECNAADTLKLIHEFEVHQIELEMQNRELILAKEKAIIDSEKYIELYDLAPTGYFTLSRNGEIIHLNISGAKMLGKDRPQLINRLFHLYISDISKPLFLHFLEKVFDRHEKETCELTLPRNDDTPIYVYITGIVSGDGSNCLITAIDITERKLLESSIVEKMILLYETERAGKIGGWAINVKTLTQNFTQETINILEIDSVNDELEIPEGIEFVDYSDRSKAELAIKRAIKFGEPFNQEWNIITGKGNNRWVNAVGKVNRAKNNIISISGSIQDITERKLAEASLLASEKKYHAIFDNIQDVFYQTDLAGTILEVSPSIKKFSEFTRDEIVGKPVTNLYVDANDRAQILDLLNKNGELRDYELRLKTKTGKLKYVSNNARLVLDTNGKPNHIDGVIRDITERKLAEKQIQRLNRVYSVLSNINQTIVRNRDKQFLFEEACRIAVENGEFMMAWIGMVNSGTNKIDVVASSGKTGDYLNNINIDLNNNALNSGPAGQAIKTGKCNFSNNIQSDGRKFYWREKAREYGFCSIIALPVIVLGKIIGVFMIYSGEIDFFNEEEIELLEEMSSDISFALEFIESEKERMLAEKALRKSEAIQRKIVSNIGDVIVIIDQNGINRYKSPNIETLFGWKPEDMVGKSTWNVVHPDDLDSAQKIVAEIALIPNASETTEIRYRRKDGKYVWIEVTIANLMSDPDIQGFLGNYHEITERMQAQAKIREKDLEFKKLSSNLPDLIFQFTRKPDGTYCVPIASEGIKNIFGCTPEDVVDDFSPISRVIHPDDAERVINEIEYSAKHLTFFTCEFRVQIPGKPMQWIFSKSTPEKLPDGSVTWYGFNADISNEKNIKAELIIAKEQAEESDRLKSAFLANMSHEIRTPMNGILGFTELLKEPDLADDQRKYFVDIIEKSGTRLLNIINDIIDISKIESGQMKVIKSLINVNDYLDQIFTFFMPEAEAKNIKLICKPGLPNKEAFLMTDSEKFYAILINLVKNALKYTETGFVEFGYNLNHSFLQFYVKDTGIGIPKDRHEAIFERFVQADILDKMARQGAGLGLSISKAYVEMLGGKIWMESEEENLSAGKSGGSTFYFTLPISASAESENTVNILNPAKNIQVNPEVLGHKLIIAEDDDASSKLISIYVQKFWNEIINVQTGTEAVEACRNNPDTNLILMDIQMPGTNGYEATRQIRQFNTDVVIIALTAFALSGDREKALDAGCNDYISKPVKKEELQKMINKYFGNLKK